MENGNRAKRPPSLRLNPTLSTRSLFVSTPNSTVSDFSASHDNLRVPIATPASKAPSRCTYPSRHRHKSGEGYHSGLHLHPHRLQKHPQRFDLHHKHSSPSPHPHSRNQSHRDLNRVFNSLGNGINNSIEEVDYRIPDPSRHLEVRVANQSLFVDPKHIQDVSPQVSAFLLREFTHHGRTSIEPQLEDLCFDEVLEAVKTLCPTELGMFPSPVTAHTFAILARLSKQFEVAKLRTACELFVARLPFLFKEVTALQLAQMLDVSCHYGLNLRTKLRLLQGTLIIMKAEEVDKTHFATYYDKAVDPVVADLIREAMASFKKGELAHDEFLDEARLKIPCRMCRVEEGSDPYSSNLKVCRRCRHTVCFHCQLSPCSTSLAKFLEKFGKTAAQRLRSL
ncbi:unnamed protein product [Bursaphelenchus okinawaensis]|uniref:BTB domain-containing protein n=1 Tax=Bursaphelenchus okinawaensis TaxID=465554 RepID=A0A811LJ72_9BILA|nr:unnamed protein product [Bursaphelenchus okinawaensis]CAG9123447.1 unnamed protein product [Bursaphelenchus okinawaensis]